MTTQTITGLPPVEHNDITVTNPLTGERFWFAPYDMRAAEVYASLWRIYDADGTRWCPTIRRGDRIV